jgi:cell fate regulator YaaT (PSP1 superfamily)
VYLFVTTDPKFKVGDACLVNSDRGLEFSTIASAPVPCEDENAERVLTKVVRRATLADKSTHEQNQQFEKEAFDTCREMIRGRGMPMKLVRVEATFNRKKIVFYFSAEERVDFRDLVKELAAKFRTRIELRQIGVRDEARLVGGLGVCGRQLCCSTFLREFAPVSIRMAKKQNLALNPAKISGLCGRLMCCILFEDSMYSECPKKNGKKTCTSCEAHAPAADEAEKTEKASDVADTPKADKQQAQPAAEDNKQTEQASGKPRSRRGRGRRRRRRKSVD